MNVENTVLDKLNQRIQTASIAGNAYLPECLRISNQADFERFQLLLDLPGITVVDQIKQQLKEFIKLSHPTKRLSDDELVKLAEAHIGSVPLWHYGCWFYYPWSNRLVHLLDKDEFIAVRTSRNHYKITPEERDVLASKKIGVVGLSVGQSVSVTLAMERICGEIRLADFDLLELTNLNRIRTGTQNLGILKVHSVAREIAELDPYIKVVCYKDGLTENNMDDFFTKGGKLDLLVEESDGFDIKILARYKARELKVPVIMEASDRCMVDVERFDLEPDRPILHGILKHLDIPTLKSLKTNEEKIPYMFDILGLQSTSAKLKASMLEMQQTITTWPQLASAVTMGGGITADVSRRLLLNDFKSSGRYYVDIDELIGDKLPVEDTLIDSAASKTSIEFDSSEPSHQHIQSNINETDLNTILQAMRDAPTFLNQQAWMYSLTENKLLIHWPNQNPVGAIDVDNTQLILSIGVVIAFAQQVAASLGYTCTELVNPQAKSGSVIVVLAFKPGAQSNDNLAAFIKQRRANWSFGTGMVLSPEHIAALTERVFPEALNVKLITNNATIAELAEAFGKGEKINLLNKSRHANYFNQVYRSETSGFNTGISSYNMQLPPAMKVAYDVMQSPQVAMCLSDWNKGLAFENYHKSLIASSEAILLVSVKEKTIQNQLLAGKTIAELWLTATKNNLSFHPICLTLTLLNQFNGEKNQHQNFSQASITELAAINNSVKNRFLSTAGEELVFVARVLKQGKTLPEFTRKSTREFNFQSHNIAV